MKNLIHACLFSSILFLFGCVMDDPASTDTPSNEASPAQTETSSTDALNEPDATESEGTEDSEASEVSEFPRSEVPLVRVIDGDTIKVVINEKEENVRFLLVDTPETNHPRMDGPQPFGYEAKEFVEKLLAEGKIELEMDVGERDRYGRLLAYVYVDGVSVQEELLRNGLARVAYIYPPNTRYVDEFQMIQEDAQRSGIGIWSVENYAQEDGFYPEYVEGADPSSPEEKNPVMDNCTVKGNISSSGEKIYHVATGAYYDRTIPEECFETEKEAEAEAAGYRKSKR